MRISGPVALSALITFGLGGWIASTHADNLSINNASELKSPMHIPADYQTRYQYLGSWSVAASKEQGAEQIHTVYASPGTIAAYRNDGRFPDGAILVKEVYEAATEPMTTGTVSRAAKLKGWFLMVRDSHNTHSGDKVWGEGWGWSWFDAGNPTKITTVDYKSECRGCHVPAQATDWIYVNGYPPLRR
jgi:hypothetical protein